MFLLGTATAAHQVEGNNIHSDFWVQENLPHSMFMEPSLDACDHYNHYDEDILLMKEAGLNAYRFSIEWARIEPEKGRFDQKEIAHYRDVLKCCRENGIEPIVTLHHFSSPKWLISEGGWEAESTIAYFTRYCGYVVEQLGELLTYVCTINEANMGVQMASIITRILQQMGVTLQIGMNLPVPEKQKIQAAEMEEAFGLKPGEAAQTFLTQRTENGDSIIIRAHESARDEMKKAFPHLKIGLSLSLHDFQAGDDSAEAAKIIAEKWEEEFLHYIPALQKDDFLGVQNYTREIISQDGVQKTPDNAELTQMNYEFYPEALANVIRKVSETYKGDILVSENGVATDDDTRRVAFIERATAGVKSCIEAGIPVIGYLYWSLLDNFEWQKGFSMKFGVISVDRQTQERSPKPSLKFLGSQKLTD